MGSIPECCVAFPVVTTTPKMLHINPVQLTTLIMRMSLLKSKPIHFDTFNHYIVQYTSECSNVQVQRKLDAEFCPSPVASFSVVSAHF